MIFVCFIYTGELRFFFFFFKLGLINFHTEKKLQKHSYDTDFTQRKKNYIPFFFYGYFLPCDTAGERRLAKIQRRKSILILLERKKKLIKFSSRKAGSTVHDVRFKRGAAQNGPNPQSSAGALRQACPPTSAPPTPVNLGP